MISGLDKATVSFGLEKGALADLWAEAGKGHGGSHFVALKSKYLVMTTTAFIVMN